VRRETFDDGDDDGDDGGDGGGDGDDDGGGDVDGVDSVVIDLRADPCSCPLHQTGLLIPFDSCSLPRPLFSRHQVQMKISNSAGLARSAVRTDLSSVQPTSES
jgi:hypothetical protein